MPRKTSAAAQIAAAAAAASMRPRPDAAENEFLAIVADGIAKLLQ